MPTTTVTWPAWVAWLMLLATLLTLLLVWAITQQIATMRRELGGAIGGIRTRRDLEAAYTAGQINREAYERLKGRVT